MTMNKQEQWKIEAHSLIDENPYRGVKMIWIEEEILYAMLILKANSNWYFSFTNMFNSDESFTKFVYERYTDLFADRGICKISQEEIDGWLKLADEVKTFTEKPAYITGGLKI